MKKGFTLLEVLIAVVITFLMVGVIYGSYRGVFGAMQKSKRVFSDYQTISHLLRRMNEEIASAFASSDLPFVGGEKELEFWTTKNAGISDLGKINYFLSQNEEGETFLLRRESIPFSEIPGKAFSLVSIDEISFRYFDGEEWSSEWDRETKLPRAVVIEIGLKEGTPFSTIIPIEKNKYNKLPRKHEVKEDAKNKRFSDMICSGRIYPTVCAMNRTATFILLILSK